MKAFALSLLTLLTCVAGAQTPAAPPAPALHFIAADVRVAAPHKFPFANGGKLYGDRYILNGATMVDIIQRAYHIDPSRVQGGPSWLEMDRFDITAKAKPKTPDADLQKMLQSLLAERFGLVVENTTRPMPAWALTVAKTGSKLHPTDDASAESHCIGVPSASGGPEYIDMKCNNRNMDRFQRDLQELGYSYLNNLPVIDGTNLAGGYDFELKFSDHMRLAQQGSDGISFFDALEKQLGLKLTQQTAPRPVLAVEHVNRTPTPNAPDIATVLPPLPQPHFDVATIKPSRPDEKSNGNISDTVVDIKNFPLKFAFFFAWELNGNDSESIVGMPHNFSTDNYDIYAKVVVDPADPNSAVTSMQVAENARKMVQDFLIERFNMKYHWEDRPVNAYNLVAVKPTMKPAAPNSRTHCIEGSGANGADPRLTNAKLNRLLTCQNFTMAQLSEELQRLAPGYIYDPVEDDTGLKGGYDFTLSFSSADLMGSGDKPKPGDADSGQAADPNGALSLPEAVRRQLGLKLEKVKRPARVLVIDHIDPKPTEN